MSIKRISRKRVTVPIYIDDEPMATRVGTKEDIRANTSVVVSPNDTRTGGNVETKSDPLSRLGGETPSRVGTFIDTREGTNVETRSSTKEHSEAASSGSKDHPHMSRSSV